MLAENAIVRPADFTARRLRGSAAGVDDSDGAASGPAAGRAEPDAAEDDTASMDGTSDGGRDLEAGGTDIEDLFSEDFMSTSSTAPVRPRSNRSRSTARAGSSGASRRPPDSGSTATCRAGSCSTARRIRWKAWMRKRMAGPVVVLSISSLLR